MQTGDRRDIDDGASALRDHSPGNGLRNEEETREVDVEHLLPSFDRCLLSRRAPARTGVVDEHIDAVELFNRPFDERFDVVFPPDVATERKRPYAELCKLGRRFLAPFELACADDDVRTELGESDRHLPADATSAAGDDRRFAGQIEQLLCPHSCAMVTE